MLYICMLYIYYQRKSSSKKTDLKMIKVYKQVKVGMGKSFLDPETL